MTCTLPLLIVDEAFEFDRAAGVLLDEALEFDRVVGTLVDDAFEFVRVVGVLLCWLLALLLVRVTVTC